MPRKKSKSTTARTVEVEESVVDVNAGREHCFHVEYTQEENPPFRTVHMKFRNENDYQEFAKRIDQQLTDSSVIQSEARLLQIVYYDAAQDDEHTLPKYPMYIVSKGHTNLCTPLALSHNAYSPLL